MKTITIHYTTPYIGTIAKQGEHNQTQLVFYLPDSFDGADFVNAEFVKRDNSTSVVDQLIPNNGTVAVPLTQDLTNVDGKMEIQLVAYKVDGTEITEIAKSGIFTCKIRKSLNVLYGEDQPGVIERILAFISYWAEKLPEMWAKKHWHDNKGLLDSLTEDDVGIKPDWGENDTTEKSFVKNRTHYQEIGETTTAKFEKHSSGSWVCTYPPLPGEVDFYYPFTVGNVYCIEYNDNEYYLKAYHAFEDNTKYLTINRIAIGNSNLASVWPFGKLPGEDPNDTVYPIDNVPPSYANIPFGLVSDVGNESGSPFMWSDFSTIDEYDTGDEVTITITPVTYNKLSSYYLSDDIQEAAILRHTHANKPVLDDFSESNGILQFDGHAVPQFPINDVEPTTQSDDYTVAWLKPNIWHRFGSADSPVRSISILELEPVDNSVAEEYVVEFWTGATAPSPVIFPLDVEWPDGSEPTWEANKHYQVSIVGNMGLYAGSDYSKEEGS